MRCHLQAVGRSNSATAVWRLRRALSSNNVHVIRCAHEAPAIKEDDASSVAAYVSRHMNALSLSVQA